MTKIVLFLGAGASVPFGKPTTRQLKEKIAHHGVTANIVEDILQSFLRQVQFPDIEYVLQSIKQILDFSENEGGHYFFEQGKNGLFNFTNGSVPFESFSKNLKIVQSILEDKIFDNYRWNRDSNDALLKIYDEIFGFLKYKTGETHIFTTNYDKAIEQYCNLRRDSYVCVDGFDRVPSHSEFSKWTGNFNAYADKGRMSIFLYKLHGSLNWKIHVDEDLVRTNEESKSNDPNFTRNVVIYPTLSPKMEEDQEPHKSIVERFRKYMKEADVCLVIGYSFRDSLNDVFEQFINRNGILIAISPSSITDYRINVLKQKPDNAQLFNWSKESSSNSGLQLEKGKMDTVHLIQKKLEVDTVKDIVKDIQDILDLY